MPRSQAALEIKGRMLAVTRVRLLDAELAAANLSIDALAARAQLAVALGGGFDPTQDTVR